MKRFWSKVAVLSSEECWPWYGSPGSNGYGSFTVKKYCFRAHRFAWMLWHGTDPGNLMVCHKCDNPNCVNPHHLFLGTASDNQQDSILKKRSLRAKQTHCKSGHSFSGDNLFYDSSGNRACRICRRASYKRYRERRHTT